MVTIVEGHHSDRKIARVDLWVSWDDRTKKPVVYWKPENYTPVRGHTRVKTASDSNIPVFQADRDADTSAVPKKAVAQAYEEADFRQEARNSLPLYS